MSRFPEERILVDPLFPLLLRSAIREPNLQLTDDPLLYELALWLCMVKVPGPAAGLLTGLWLTLGAFFQAGPGLYHLAANSCEERRQWLKLPGWTVQDCLLSWAIDATLERQRTQRSLPESLSVAMRCLASLTGPPAGTKSNLTAGMCTSSCCSFSP